MDCPGGGCEPIQAEPLDPLEALPPALQVEWDAALGELGGEISRVDFQTWVSCTTPLGLDRGTLVIGTGNPFAATWLEQHVQPRLITRLGRPVRFEVRHGSRT
ncbi:MAG TPA: DnaA N-terminal domain-containing protein [Bellilinea sp.]|nr:DnaA N-terminal domain-containing protein [Bellilinea sp.]